MLVDTQPALDEYTVLRDGAALQLRPTAGVLVLTDADRADFLQRMTTNNVAALRAGQACVTVLTSPTAKIVQVFTVALPASAPETLWLLPAPGETAALERHLRGQIFFMDKVRVANRSADLARLRLMGPQATAVLAALGFELAQTADGAVLERDGLLAVVQQAGAVPVTDDRAVQARRVELGRPAPGAELTGEYNPLEAGLAWACADNKGCYTGQEIIARQLTYDKVTRMLVGLRSAAPLATGAVLTADGRDVGVVTSAAWSPALAAHLALAIVKRPHNATGIALQAGGAAVIVQELPFTH